MKLAQELIALIKTSETKEVFCDVAEIALDSKLEDGLIKDLPLIGGPFRIGSAIFSIRERIEIRKVGKFLDELRAIPQQKIDEFLDGLQSNEARTKLGERLLILLDHQDELEKARLLGTVFRYYILGEISRDYFDIIAHGIGQAYLGDLDGIDLFLDSPELLDDTIGSALLACGFVKLRITSLIIGGGGFDDNSPRYPNSSKRYELTPYGQAFAEIIRKEKG